MLGKQMNYTLLQISCHKV